MLNFTPIRLGLVFTFILNINVLMAQINSKVLHYSETSGFDHQTRASSLSMFQSFPNLNVVNDIDGSEFDSLSNLLSFDLIVFSNTSGNQILDSTQRSHFEAYIQQGGNLLGIHAASDTYRHSSANGIRTGTWDFYAKTIGGSVQENPNHVAGTPAYDISVIGSHPSSNFLPNPWNKNEEYYYWENGYLDSTINVILEVETTIGPNNLVNSFDSSRAVSWFKILPTSSKVFYTSMGHANSNYTSDSLFQKHIQLAVEWTLGLITGIENISSQNNNTFRLHPNPSSHHVFIQSNENEKIDRLIILDNQGKIVQHELDFNPKKPLNIEQLSSGLYFVEIHSKGIKSVEKFIKN